MQAVFGVTGDGLAQRCRIVTMIRVFTYILRLPLMLLFTSSLLASVAGLLAVAGAVVFAAVLLIAGLFELDIDATWFTDTVSKISFSWIDSPVGVLIASPFAAAMLIVLLRVMYMALEFVVEQYWRDNWQRTQRWKTRVLEQCR